MIFFNEIFIHFNPIQIQALIILQHYMYVYLVVCDIKSWSRIRKLAVVNSHLDFFEICTLSLYSLHAEDYCFFFMVHCLL